MLGEAVKVFLFKKVRVLYKPIGVISQAIKIGINSIGEI